MVWNKFSKRLILYIFIKVLLSHFMFLFLHWVALQKRSATKSPTLRLRSFRWFILPSFLNPTAFREHTEKNPSSCWSSGWAAKLHNATFRVSRHPFLSLGGAAYEIHCRLEALLSDSSLISVQTFCVEGKVFSLMVQNLKKNPSLFLC